MLVEQSVNMISKKTHCNSSLFSLTKGDPCVFCWQEFPFFTLTSFPPGFLVHVGGVVSARSVKLLDRIHNPGEFNTFAQWPNLAGPLFCETL